MSAFDTELVPFCPQIPTKNYFILLCICLFLLPTVNMIKIAVGKAAVFTQKCVKKNFLITSKKKTKQKKNVKA